MNKKEAAKVLAILKSSYPAVKFDNSEATVNIWAIAFADLEADIVMRAAIFHLNKSKYFPSIAEIRQETRRAILTATPVKAIEAHTDNAVITPKDDAFLDAFCKWIGLGCDPDDDIYINIEDYRNGGTGLEKI